MPLRGYMQLIHMFQYHNYSYDDIKRTYINLKLERLKYNNMFTLAERTTKDKIKELINNSAFTFEGVKLDDEDLKLRYDTMQSEFNIINPGEHEVYMFTGKDLVEAAEPEYTMRDYPEDVYLVSIPLDVFSDIGRLAMIKLIVGARWLDDIVQNASGYWD